ncbi:MAG: DUF3365 domain-containing protein [Rhodocyclaceae bacterium]|nr:DUF3365 domain-containing protein [Rhodocyclaceae bacterium]
MFIAALAALPAFGDEGSYLEDARQVASSLPPRLLQVLVAEIGKGGPESAISVCRERAPLMAKAASEKTGWAIRRVSLRPRNPKAAPDAWEKAVLEDFDRRAAAGESPALLEKSEVVAEGGQRVFRYMKALPTQEVCLLCHGAPERLTPPVTAKLRELYPDDQATGYEVGQVRGAITLKKPL